VQSNNLIDKNRGQLNFFFVLTEIQDPNDQSLAKIVKITLK